MLTIDDIDRWNVVELELFAKVCGDVLQHCEDLEATLDGRVLVPSWEGDASIASHRKLESMSRAIAETGGAVHDIREAVATAVSGVRSVKDDLASIRDDLSAATLAVNQLTAQVFDPDPPRMQGWMQEEKAQHYQLVRDLQGRINDILSTADRIDRNLATAIGGGFEDQAAPSSVDAEASDTLDRNQTQIDAFHQVYARDPISVNDWRMAEALDPQTYLTVNKGADSNVVVGTIEPREGYGMVRTNLYIPGEQAQNFTVNPADILDGRAFPNNAGDSRGPDPYAGAGQSRISVYVDYENGVVVARQNPTVVTSGPNLPVADDPQIRVAQAADGSVRVNYFATDAYQPVAGKLVGVGVEGDVTLHPSRGGSAVLAGGTVGTFPSAEIYQYLPDGNVVQVANYEATGSEYGPMSHLIQGPNNEIGVDVPQVGEPPLAPRQMGYPGSQQGLAPEVGTHLGPASAPPRVEIVESGR